MAQRWWTGKPDERFWLEATDRDDIGGDLRAPLMDAAGHENWRYTLFRETRPGDVVLHYDGNAGAITGWSTVAGPPVPRPITWAARGSYARERGARPSEVPGYSVPLRELTPLKAPITLVAMRERKNELIELTRSLRKEFGNAPLYFPFEISNRPVRPLQGYSFKIPAMFLKIFEINPKKVMFEEFALVGDAGVCRKYFEEWRKALLADAVRETGLWRAPTERFVFSNLDDPSSLRLGRRTSLGIDPLGQHWVVQINEPERPGDANSLAGIAMDPHGRPFLVRQGMLRGRSGDDQPISFDAFRRLTGAAPIAVTNGNTRIQRDWYIVTALEIPPDEIRQNTSSFVDLCALARAETSHSFDAKDAPVLQELRSSDETGGTYLQRGRLAVEPREVRRIQGEVWQQMAALIRTNGGSVNKPRHADGYEVDAEVLRPDRCLLFEIKTGATAAEVYGGLGQLQLYRKLLPSLEHHEPVLLMPRLPTPALAAAVRACGISLVTYSLSIIGAKMTVSFSLGFYEICGIAAPFGDGKSDSAFDCE